MTEVSKTLGELRLDLLSTREREVLDLGVLGRTDEQMSQELGLTVATVNSYWVRIRGKLGPFSRVEIVGAVLRHESGLRHADLIAEVERLKASELQGRKELAAAERHLKAERGGGWHRHALDHVSDATFVCRSPGEVVYANLQAEHLFAAEPGELEKLRVWELAIPQHQEARRLAASAFFDKEGPQRVVVGAEGPYYAHRRDGTNFRAILIGERFLAPEGIMAVVTVREYMQDVEALIRHLRKPFELVP